MAAIAALFGVPARHEPYAPGGEPVYRLDLLGPAANMVIILWPSLGRVDVRAGTHSWVLKGVGAVEVIAGVEVVFRSAETPGFLFVAVNGWVSMVSG